MEKRLMVAMLLSVAIVLAWTAMYPPPKPKPTVAPTQPEIVKIEPVKQQPIDNKRVTWETEHLIITFNETTASIADIEFPDYFKDKLPLIQGGIFSDKSLIFNKLASDNYSISFIHKDAKQEIKKVYKLSKSKYLIELEVTVRNLTETNLSYTSSLSIGTVDYSVPMQSTAIKNSFPPQELTISSSDKIIHWNGKKDRVFDNVKFIGLSSRYFCVILGPVSGKGFSAYVKKIDAKTSDFGISTAAIDIAPNQTLAQGYKLYLGPRDIHLISDVEQDWSSVVYFGTFDLISQVILQILEFFQRFTNNWGLAIVLLSIFVFIVLYPLTLKQMHSMKEMQVLQPKVEELRNKFKDNPQKLNKEIMELYREHKVNPLGGCLPLLLQMPVFFALYRALLNSISLKGAQFLWIKDLSAPDKLYVFQAGGKSIDLNLLPILMTIGMFIQQKISTVSSTSNAAAEQQKMMLIVMPIIFGFVFYNMPSGLVLYWFVNSTLMLINQWRISRVK